MKSNTITLNKNKKILLQQVDTPPLDEIVLRNKKKPIDDYIDDLNVQ